jgi:hypothetical protein
MPTPLERTKPMTAVNGAEWLDALHRHYDRTWTMPLHVATELLLDMRDAATVAAAIVRRGKMVGDDLMANCTVADVEAAMLELEGIGFIGTVFVTDHPSVKNTCWSFASPTRIELSAKPSGSRIPH